MTAKYTQEDLKALDFELWVDLAQQDSDTFESMRLAAIEELIASASEQGRQRLRCLQWRIDQERHLSKSPMGACIRISRMMWETLAGEGGLAHQIHYLNDANEHGNYTSNPYSDRATVTPIRPNS